MLSFVIHQTRSPRLKVDQPFVTVYAIDELTTIHLRQYSPVKELNDMSGLVYHSSMLRLSTLLSSALATLRSDASFLNLPFFPVFFDLPSPPPPGAGASRIHLAMASALSVLMGYSFPSSCAHRLGGLPFSFSLAPAASPSII